MTFRCGLAMFGVCMLSLFGQVQGEEFWNDLPSKMERDPAALAAFLKSHKISDTDSNGWAPIHWLARSGKTEALRRVVRKGGDVNQAAAEKQQTRPVQLAAGEGWAEGVAVLLELGAEVKGETGIRAMKMACSHGEDGTPKVIQILVEAGVSPNGQPLWDSISNKRYRSVEALLTCGADINQRNRKIHQMTPLIYACQMTGDPRMTRLVLKFHPDLDLKAIYPFVVSEGYGPHPSPPNERTALMSAAERGQLKIVQILIEAGSDPAILDQEGKTALELARHKGHFDVEEYLKLHPVKNGKLPGQGSAGSASRP